MPDKAKRFKGPAGIIESSAFEYDLKGPLHLGPLNPWSSRSRDPLPMFLRGNWRMATGRTLRTLILSIIMAGGGGGRPGTGPPGLVNQTQQSQAGPSALWEKAQQSRARRRGLKPPPQ